MAIGPARSRRRTALGAAGATALLACAAVPFVRQPLRLPLPTGSFPVGTVAGPLPPWTVSDATPTAFVQLWYPARPGTGGAGLVGQVEVRWRGLRFKRQFATSAIPGAPAADGGFPLLLYVPGWGGGRASNTALAQDLASHGFVVAAMDPVSVPPGGAGMDFSSAEANAATLRLAGELVQAQARDMVALLDRLRAGLGHGAAFAPLAGGADFSRVGIFGFSFGGAVAAEACWADPRFHAALNMDGWLFGHVAWAGIAQPFMVLSDDTPLPGAAELALPRPEARFTAALNLADNQRVAAIMARHGGVRATIEGTRHSNFSDDPLVWPIRRMVDAGPADPAGAHALISGYVVAFFCKHLRGEDPALLRPEAVPPAGVRLERWGAPGAS